MNLKDFMMSNDSPTILVKGIGKVRLDQAKKRVQEMLHDLSGRVDNLVWEPGHDQRQWQALDSLVKRGTLQAYLEAISEAVKQQH